MAAQAQNAVEQSSSVTSSRWMSAAPKARSAKTMTRDEKTMTSAATPKSAGLSSRARMSATTSRDVWRNPWDTSFQTIPATTQAAQARGRGGGGGGRRRGVAGGRGRRGRGELGRAHAGSPDGWGRSSTTPSAASRNASIVTCTKLKASKVSIPIA